jgi:hypothetical protein
MHLGFVMKRGDLGSVCIAGGRGDLVTGVQSWPDCQWRVPRGSKGQLKACLHFHCPAVTVSYNI